MRTTVNIADDVYAEVERLRREAGLGSSEAINVLARRGMRTDESPVPYVHRSGRLGLRLDVSNIGDLLDALEDDGQPGGR